jgi:hypothetical protein
MTLRLHAADDYALFCFRYHILPCTFPNMTDEMIEDSAAILVKHVEDCQQAKGIHDLMTERQE